MKTADPGAYGSSFLAATKVASADRPRLAAELDVDVCVIGAGLAGLTVAREVARRGWSVVVLEAHSVAWNASGRNTGFVLPGYAAGAKALVTRTGFDDAKKLWALSEAGAEYVRRIVQDEQMPGVELAEGGWLHVTRTSDEESVQAEAELLGRLGAEVEFQSAERVREQLRSPLYFSGLYYPRGFSLHSLNYALGLAAAAERDGARIFENSAALEIDPAGVRKRVTTKDARVRAHHVVLAGNIHLAGLMPQFGNTLLPQHSYVIVTAPLGDALHEAIRFPGAVSDTDLADNHYCVVEGNRLMWSGRSTVWRGKPQDYVATLLGQIRRTFPQLRNVKAEYAWTGLIGNTVHRMPQIGEITPGLWLLSGFGARGLNTTAMAGEIVARAIVDVDKTWQMFSPFALVWSGGVYGRVAQQVAYWSNRINELVVSRMAQRREERRLRELEAEAAVAEQGPAVPLAAEVTEAAVAEQGPAVPLAAEVTEAAVAEQEPAVPLVAEVTPAAVEAAPAVPEVTVEIATMETPPVIAAEDAPEILLQPAPAAAPAKAKRGRRKKKNAANAASDAPPGAGA